MSHATMTATLFPNVTIGLDLGDRTSHPSELTAARVCQRHATVPTTRAGLTRSFADRPRARAVYEVGTHSPWVTRLLTALGHEVIVANPSAMFAGAPRRRRNDRLDAEFLARQGRADVALLHPITHRSAEAQQDLAGLRARDQLVAARTKLINHVRGAVKATGERLAACSAEAFAARATRALPAALAPALTPLVEVIGDLPRRIRQADAQLRISKAGDELGRRLLVSAAQYILGPFGPPCDLQRYGAAIAARGGTNAKKRAVVAVARKLAVLLHHLWISGATYAPDYQLKRRTPPPA